ncbi:tRNA uridine-5-carboxymethylaminomethyl(34) synthesis enzyme MnmG [Candidatus Sulfidibacterium hydrothermale]|uniref:tRNA uridine-5-carboxymethylaminomethyl(34) synthesis enzyme MnmG n=1 Tax=Candidatus Sulfidibacterium hydrothermale TaxID=2875962 RepID=UPI001F0A881D|nr:tRNA uridine-5-carboxymethylaminomethyl(34) synthesis enzyme MnmG [Candidatus Sulfidibacterium hydrothermale]
MFEQYDVIVVGAGHAGSEAAAAAANLGSKTLLITMNLNAIAQMSCNPAMGGIAKGQIVREIDALGGYSGIVTDKSMIQFRMLNKSKGPAMWSPRAQSDRMLFSAVWRNMLEQTPNLDFWQDTVTGLLIRGDYVIGVKTAMGIEIKSKTVILTNGTFLNGKIHIGTKQFPGGRLGDPASYGLSDQIKKLGFETLQLKTGTPVRIDGRTIDFSKMEEQKGDENPGNFSFFEKTKLTKQKSCWITYTSPQVHDTLKLGFSESPMFTGRIKGVGPRYCPSIEDKIERFSDKSRHQLFVEPEGWNTIEYYLNGFSSSLPDHIQVKALRKIPGLENAKIFRPGYAIEYDYFSPTQLNASLETKKIKNLFFAGQINGTTGYEEAAAQGIMAGINAHRKIKEEEPFILKRSEAYIGVLIDDLITKGVDEPYRMFTSRAEHRILLRQDNADTRLTEKGYQLGLVPAAHFEKYQAKKEKIEQLITFLKETGIAPEQINHLLEKNNTAPLKQKVKLATVLLRPQIRLSDLTEELSALKTFTQKNKIDDQCIESAEIQIKYDGYIKKEQEIAIKLDKLENIPLKPDFNYQQLKSISYEAREKLTKIKPKTIGQAARISGVSPSDINVLLVYLGR